MGGIEIYYVNNTNIQVDLAFLILFGACPAFGGTDQYSSTQHEAPFSKGTRDADLGAKVQFSPRPWVSLLRGLPLLRGSAGFKGKAAAFQLDFFGS